MNTGIVTFATCGYAVINGLIGEQELAWARKMTDALVERYRSGEPLARAAGVSIGDASRQHPQRNPDVEPGQYSHEPFIIGDLVALEPGFARFLCQQSIWTCAARLLDCAPAEVLFHFSNITRKPGEIGPAVGWHRDADNRYFASDDGRTLRLLIPLQHMSAGNGGTAVVPGSHLHAETAIDTALSPDVPAAGCLALHSGTLHGGLPNRSRQNRDVIVIQFGVRSSHLRAHASEAMALSSREDFLKVVNA
ncbi:phytanoyl-CoA dioxygenase family protein [Pseudomonas psychrophila]|uniref:phytanoyl-CoA dioxygenase family protein n=1 Tax=Pseudomonas psychrophila TaxID=122355 RepID=UPI000357E7ED|nr:phytanoyl-CoA dioxygenase family protein [Pseudomonas psychrophila]EPJ93840.1 Phytanoyl-CoA dioxygenase [Pseudomonas psychrophila]